MNLMRSRYRVDKSEEGDALSTLLSQSAPEVNPLANVAEERILSIALSRAARPPRRPPALRWLVPAAATMLATLFVVLHPSTYVDKPAVARAPIQERLTIKPNAEVLARRADESVAATKTGGELSVRIEDGRLRDGYTRRNGRSLRSIARTTEPRAASLPPIELVAPVTTVALVVPEDESTQDDSPAVEQRMSEPSLRIAFTNRPPDLQFLSADDVDDGSANSGFARTVSVASNADGSLYRSACIVRGAGSEDQVVAAATEGPPRLLSLTIVQSDDASSPLLKENGK